MAVRNGFPADSPGSTAYSLNVVFNSPGRRTRASTHDAQLAPDEHERVDRLLQVFLRVRRRHLRPDASLALRHDGVREADDVDAVIEQAFGELRGQPRIAEEREAR